MGEYGGHHHHHHIIENTFSLHFPMAFVRPGRLHKALKPHPGFKKSALPITELIFFFDVLEQVGSRTFIIVAGCSMHVVITLRQLRCIRLNLAQVAKRSHGFAFRIHPSHVGTSPSLLIVRFWFDQVSPSLTASWHKFSVCSIREWERG